MSVDPAQLRMLALVEAHRSLSGAAAELGVTPAALSGRVSRAEARWGVSLVARGPRGARLTEAGRTLARHGTVVDEACARAAADMAGDLEQASQRLRIGTFISVALRVLPEAVTVLRHRHPGSDLSVVEGTSPVLGRQVADGDLDLAVVATYDDRLALPPWLHAVPLLRDPLVACLPTEHRLADTPADRRIRLAQLRGERWVAILSGETARAQFDRASASVDLAPRVQFETQSYDVAQALVATGLGVAVLSQLAARPVPGATHRALERPRLHRRLWAVHARDTRLTPLADEFVGLLREVCDDLDERWRTQPLAASVRMET